MAESDIAPLELAKSALSLLQDGSDSEDEVLALSLVASAVALHLLKQPQYRSYRRRLSAGNHVESRHSIGSSPDRVMPEIMKASPQFEIRNEAVIDTSIEDKSDECTSSNPAINDFKIDLAPTVLLSESTNEEQNGTHTATSQDAPHDQSEDSNHSSSSKRRKRQWSKFEDERRRVLLRLSSNDSLDLFCAEPKITDYMSIFLDSLKMDIGTFNLLLSLVRKDIEHQNTCMRMTVAPEQRLAIVLRYLSTGESYNSIERAVKVSRSFLCVNVPSLCKAIWTNLKDHYLKLPSCEGEWASKAEEYDTRWQFPLCLGTLTRRHFKFKTPRSANVMALVDANCTFLHVDIEKEEEGVYLAQENAPPPQSIGNNRVLPYVFIADSGFDLDEHVMTPFTNPDTPVRQTFNSRLAASTRAADETFRQLMVRFNLLSTPTNILQPHIEDAIRACCVLHNFLMQHNPDLYLSEDEFCPKTTELIPLGDTNHSNENAEAIREQFAEYFANEGMLPTFDIKMLEDEGTSASNGLLDMLSF